MKKIITILLIAMIAAGSTIAQTAKSVTELNGTTGREVIDLTCPPGSRESLRESLTLDSQLLPILLYCLHP